MYLCEKCKVEFNYKDEVVFLVGDHVVQDEEHGGSGDIDHIICNTCHDE